nr:Chain B, ADM [Homo sapiens]
DKDNVAPRRLIGPWGY